MTGTAAECIRWLLDQPEGTYEARRKPRKRTTTQNAYYWAMLGKLAAKLRLPSSEVHLQMLREHGPYDAMDIRADVPLDDYFKYYDVVSTGTIKGQPYRLVKVYKRSSRMDSGEFSRLVDGLRDECRQQGIPFMTPSEVAALKYVEGDSNGD